jgi:hypothetical protein
MPNKAKCANCGTIREFSEEQYPGGLPEKFCCSKCGVLNTPQDENTGTGEQACGCLMPTDPSFLLPAGEFRRADGELEYATADDGTRLSRRKWIEIFGTDPTVLWRSQKKLGEEGVEGYYNTSTLADIKKKMQKRAR